MMWDDPGSLEAALEGLSVRDADPERVERIRALCVAALAKRRRKAGARRHAAARWRGRLELVAAAGLAILYLAGALERVLEVLS